MATRPLSTSSLSIGFQAFLYFSLFLARTEVLCKQDYNALGLKLHNEKRALHEGVPPLALDKDLQKMALSCAKYYVSHKVMDHSCPFKTTNKFEPYSRAGENIFRNRKIRDEKTAVSKAVQMWYDEIKYWDFETSTVLKGRRILEAFHFTQLIWKSSRKLGIGYHANSEYGTIVVALYGPPGNDKGYIEENVPPLAGEDNDMDEDAGED